MYCSVCGSMLSDNSVFCGVCGSKVPVDGQPENKTLLQSKECVVDLMGKSQNPSTSQGNAFEQGKQQSKERQGKQPPHEYRKLGGFLLFLVVTGYIGVAGLVIASVLSFVGVSTLSAYASRSSLATAFMMIALFTGIGYLVGAGIEFIWVRKIHTKDQGFLKFYFYYSVVCMVVYFAASLSNGILVALVSTAFYSLYIVPWFIYYTKSVRVRTYMGSDEYMRKCPIAKSMTPPKPAVPDEEEENIEKISCGYGSEGNREAPTVSHDGQHRGKAAVPEDKGLFQGNQFQTQKCCPVCGCEMLRDARFCGVCGTQLQ